MAASFDMIECNTRKHIEVFERLLDSHKLKQAITVAAEKLCTSYKSGGKLLLCGNGGSAADSQHIAAEFVGRFRLERNAYPAIALHCNTSSVTAIGNDYGYEWVFSRQVEAFARENDVLIGISTSGGSKSILQAIETAKEHGCYTIFLTGNACRNTETADLTIKAPSEDTPMIQEMHIFIGHFLAEYVEMKLNESRGSDA